MAAGEMIAGNRRRVAFKGKHYSTSAAQAM
jgi:hypothetical protein